MFERLDQKTIGLSQQHVAGNSLEQLSLSDPDLRRDCPGIG